MFTVYVLKSLRNSKRYVGFTSRDVNLRLHEHNSGYSTFTSQNGPFVIVYTKVYGSKLEAGKREKYLKSGQGRKFLDGVIKI